MKYHFRWYDSIIAVLAIYLFLFQVQAIWPFTIDDMYISLRYAKNWALGNGLLWNVHAPPVEGYSNFSFVVLAAFALSLKVDPVIVLKAAGVLGLFFTCFFLYLITRFWFEQRSALLPCIALLFYKGQIIWAVSGLETALYQAFICGSVYFCFRGMGYQHYPKTRGEPQGYAFILAGLCLTLAGLTRPEAPALMVLFFILLCWDRPQEGGISYWRGIILFTLTLAIFFIPYFSWRFFYFGYLFPNSVYCKGVTKAFSLSLDFNYLKLIWPFALLALIACIKIPDKRYYFLWLPSLAYLLMLADADPIVAFDNRLFLPALALLLPLALQGVNWIASQYVQNSSLALNVLFLGIALMFIPKMSLLDYRYFSQNPQKGERLREEVIQWLKANTKPGWDVVLADSGMIPYYSDLNFIDSYCLNNLAMGHSFAKQRYEQFCREIMQRKPDIIILTSLVEQGRVIYTPSDLCLASALKKQNDYTLRQSFNTNDLKSTYRYELFSHHK
ncbi:protein LphB [Legionella rowbothamii]|uniref:protein LphB n=1 Tax=Legionella rowbothamii TaxID=96229 RepID=UPI001054C26D|nr:protein LphB [Legionella rowbothamii]